MRLQRRDVAWAKEEAAELRKEAQNVGGPKGWPRRCVPPLISEEGPLLRRDKAW
jgi:hypothetical protein